MRIREQQPLSLKSEPKPRFSEEDLKQRSERFRQARADLEARMSTDEFKKMKWAKLARKKGIPYFDPPVSLEPSPIAEIKAEPMKLMSGQFSGQSSTNSVSEPQVTSTSSFRFVTSQESPLERDKRFIGRDWKEDYTWDLVSREVALTWSNIKRFGGDDPRKAQVIWFKALKEGNKNILLARLKSKVIQHIDNLHVQEWNRFVKNADLLRKQNDGWDAISALTYYNDDIRWEEKQRRWLTLHLPTAEAVVNKCTAIAQAPKPEGWHSVKKCKFTQEMYDSIDYVLENCPELDYIPEVHLEKRRQMFWPYWKTQRAEWERSFTSQLKEWKEKNDHLGQWDLGTILAKELQPRACLAGWRKSLNAEIEQAEIDLGHEELQLRLSLNRILRENRPKEYFEACRQLKLTEAKKERVLRTIANKHEKDRCFWEDQLSFFNSCTGWLRIRDVRLRTIKKQAQQELKKIEKMQDLEFNELFPPSEDSDSEPIEESSVDLNAEIAQAIARHSILQSPADCSSQRGYGDFVESARSEKSGSSSWSLLGIRGLEAVQVSSHRGPPTDRPPDKPPPALGVFAGCLQERAGTRDDSQLASSSRGSHCSSGNALPYAVNAVMGICAIEQFRVHAAGSCHEVNRELSWTLPRCGRFRAKRGTCVTIGHPPLNLGRNLSPPRRFSYHTRFSRFNGTA
jgi:hypothetical protein